LSSSTGGGVGESGAALIASRLGLLTLIYPVVAMQAHAAGRRAGTNNASCRKLEKPGCRKLENASYRKVEGVVFREFGYYMLWLSHRPIAVEL